MPTPDGRWRSSLETFAKLSGLADRLVRREGEEMLRLIDATPIPLGKVVEWAKRNGRIRGLKMHVVYDPVRDNPTFVDITDANVNDIEVGRAVPIAAGCTYVYDKGYCRYDWWASIDAAGACFVTRMKKSARFRAVHWRPVSQAKGCGFTILDDAEVKLVSKGDSKLAIAMRRIRLKRDDGTRITLLTNDLERSAVEIGSLYKRRWQIELLFRWIKQHLKITTFLGRNPNAIRLQLMAAMIAYLSAAHRRQAQLPQDARHPLRRTRRRPSVHPNCHRQHRQAKPIQPLHRRPSIFFQPAGLPIRLNFPRTALR